MPWKLRVNAVEKHINSIFNGKSVVIIFSGPLPYKGSKFLRVPLFASGPLTSVCAGADPASGKGGPNCWPITGVPWGWPPGGGPGGRAPLRREILNFWTQFARFGAYFLPTSYWKSLDLFPIKVFFFFFFFLNYGIGLYKNGSFIVFTLVPPRVPEGVLLRPIILFLAGTLS